MLYTSDANLLAYLESEQKHRLDEVLHRRNFTVQDTLLSYRQIHELDGEGLLDTGQESKGEWRKFSFHELVYLKIVHELKGYGFKYVMLRPLHDSFFYSHGNKTPKNKDGIYRATKRTAEVAIGMAMYTHQEIIITGSVKKGFNYFDVINFPIHGLTEKSCVVLNLNELIFELLDSANIKHDKNYVTLSEHVLKKTTVSTSEREMLLKVRDVDTRKIEVKKQDGKIALITAEREHGAKTTEEIDTVLKASAFQDVRITRRDGKVLRVISDEVIKIS